MTERDVVLLFVDALNRAQGGDRNPILIADLQAQILEARRSDVDVANLNLFSPTMLFHLLRQLVEDGLVARQYDGYVVTETGRARADELRQEARAQVDAMQQAAERAFERIA